MRALINIFKYSTFGMFQIPNQTVERSLQSSLNHSCSDDQDEQTSSSSRKKEAMVHLHGESSSAEHRRA